MDRESAARILKGIVTTENIQGTDLISVRVRHTGREDARDIAAEVARAYRKYREEMESKTAEKGISELKKAIRKQEDKSEEWRKILSIIGRGAEGQSSQDYVDAKRDFETEQSLLEQLKLKLATEEIQLSIGGTTIVVHDDPVIADSPISPNVTLNLLIGIVGGALISPFLALPVMWMMNRRQKNGIA